MSEIFEVSYELFLLFALGSCGFLGRSTILGTSLLTIGYTGAVQHTADDVVTNTRQVTYTTTTNQDNGVLLKVVTFAANISGDFLLVRQSYPSHFPHRGVRLLRRHRLDLKAYPSLERAGFEHWRFAAVNLGGTWRTNQLVNGRHGRRSFLNVFYRTNPTALPNSSSATYRNRSQVGWQRALRRLFFQVSDSGTYRVQNHLTCFDC